MVVGDAVIDLVSYDPDAAFAREVEDRLLFPLAAHPTRWVVG